MVASLASLILIADVVLMELSQAISTTTDLNLGLFVLNWIYFATVIPRMVMEIAAQFVSL